MSIDWQYQEEKQNFDLIENSYTDYPLFVCPIIGIKLWVADVLIRAKLLTKVRWVEVYICPARDLTWYLRRTET